MSCLFLLLRFLSFLSAFEIHSGPSLHDLLSGTCHSRDVFLESVNSSCHEIISSRTSVGRFPTLVLDDLLSWHEELPDCGNTLLFDMFR